MKFFVAVTDNDWFRYLADRENLEEVNFWQPRGPRPFRALQPGDLFLFKLHWPDNYIVGGGTYTYAPPTGLPVSLAWEAFGPNNGAPSFSEMLGRIAPYRKADHPGRADYDIGCIILTDPFFFEPDDWMPAPADFAKNIVTGKGHTLEIEASQKLWQCADGDSRRSAQLVDRPIRRSPDDIVVSGSQAGNEWSQDC